jgi:hypothetical protein
MSMYRAAVGHQLWSVSWWTVETLTLYLAAIKLRNLMPRVRMHAHLMFMKWKLLNIWVKILCAKHTMVTRTCHLKFLRSLMLNKYGCHIFFQHPVRSARFAFVTFDLLWLIVNQRLQAIITRDGQQRTPRPTTLHSSINRLPPSLDHFKDASHTEISAQ